jgi:hypothetical protein
MPCVMILVLGEQIYQQIIFQSGFNRNITDILHTDFRAYLNRIASHRVVIIATKQKPRHHLHESLVPHMFL